MGMSARQGFGGGYGGMPQSMGMIMKTMLQSMSMSMGGNEQYASTWTTGEEEGTTSDCCYWSGITCNNQSHVISLSLRYGYLEGKISPSLLNLSYLNSLDLSLNWFNGTIPMFIGSMTQLRYLKLGANDFSGTIPSLLNLSYLNSLDLSENSFNGTIPMFIGSMTQLRYLYLSVNDFSGTIPSEFGNLTNLQELYLYSLSNCTIENLDCYNNLNSSMFHWLFPLTSNALADLYLSRNMLDGIPKYFGNLCGLTSLYFKQNSMPINLPDFLSNLSGCTSVTLQDLVASSSQFTGSLSDDIENFSSLQYLSLSYNQLNGTISEKVWQLPNLQNLYVSSNFLKGAIFENIEKSNISRIENIGLSSCNLGPRFPKWIQAMKNLSGIDISNNRISDDIPEDFWNMWPSRLTYLNISFNNFYGPISNAPSSLVYLDLSNNNLSGQIFFLCQIVDGSLSFLDLSNNAFTGPIPDCLWHFTNLRVLSLGYNNLSGRLPISIKFLIHLEVLYLYNNKFSGKLPLSLMNFTGLTFLNLGANKFSGYVPGWIGERLSGLYALILTSNEFIGTIPSHLCQLANLQILDLSMNKLQGTIPTCLSNLTSMVQDGSLREFGSQNVHFIHNIFDGEYVDHSMIKWQGSLHEFGSTLGLVKIINLSSNKLTGKIPDQLTDLHNLIALDLSMNALVGEIPSKIGQMKELQILDLSRNNLIGGLPSSMSQMTLLNYLDVSYNNLSGRIPSSTQLQSFEPSRYTGNAGLCGLPLSKYCPGDKELDPPVTHENMDDKEGTNDLQKWEEDKEILSIEEEETEEPAVDFAMADTHIQDQPTSPASSVEKATEPVINVWQQNAAAGLTFAVSTSPK
ncbi:hypothetical protein M8C21_002390 [Ambrosia artemisiifolia]|uniref:Uncharacterized protein n=1 Tax=Ambrosia artemisiifolia TaxID=4212 RepID=A0AAD5CPZ7_AMBAR|nr:hypothetical protein M8C21_002390 [Ambrosia artemisiifolia]